MSWILILLAGCSTIPMEQRAPLRQEIDTRAAQTIESLAKKDPQFREQYDQSVGYFAGRLSSTKLPVVGAGFGLGVLHDKEQQTRAYMDVRRFDLGAGLAAGAFRALVLFNNREAMDRFHADVWKSGIGAESELGEKGASWASYVGDDLSLFVQAESGARMVASARAISIAVNEDLTDTGISQVSIPNTGFTTSDRQAEGAPRHWEHRLPFLAQKVIDKGYDLPLPYGVALTYVDVDQEMLLDELEVGINGRDEQPFEFVSFDNASAFNDTNQLKVDTWLFPFMNVFGMLGKIDGKAPMDVVLDGNGMLDHLGTDCSGLLKPPICKLLDDKTFTLPITAKFSGKTYGIGTVLAGGWNNWFVSLPFSITYADMDDTNTDGFAYTFTPRAGRVFNLGKRGNLAFYGGANYLRTDLTITGQVSTPDGSVVIDYTIEQKNKDELNLLLGANWDINKRWSLLAEYNGFIGSREAFIASLTRRF